MLFSIYWHAKRAMDDIAYCGILFYIKIEEVKHDNR